MWMLRPLTVFLLTTELSAKIVTTVSGQVDGNTVTLDDGSIINSWYGVPFAAPPVGALRFEQPQVPQAWDGVRETKALPDVCIQDPSTLLSVTHPGYNNLSEDCLNLNIFAPEDLTDAPLPVMVWLHGGAYITGGNIQYPGHFLAARGVIVVVPNYRLDAFGFLATPDGTVRGNMGLYDQAAALRWVRNNVVAFGGDANRVTIFGQSAGAGSTSLHLVSPFSDGLFHQAILESGSDNNVWTLNYPGQRPETYVYQLAAKTNCERPSDNEMIECLRTKSATDIRLASSINCTPGYFCQGYAPIVDGPGGFIPKIPFELRQELDASKVVPTIGGICADDGSVYTAVLIPETFLGGVNSTEFNNLLRTRIVDIFAAQLTPEQYEQVYEAMRWFYVDHPYVDDLDANREAFNELLTDAMFGYPWDRQLRAISEKNPNTYAYVQTYSSSNTSSSIPSWMGVTHGLDVPYVFGYAKLLNNPAVRVDSGIFYDGIGWTQDDIDYSDYMITLWTNFAKYSNPTPQPVKAPFDDSLTTWEKFSFDDNLKVLDLGYNITTQTNFRSLRNAFFYDYLSTIVERPVMMDPGHSTEAHNELTSSFRFNSDTIKETMKLLVVDSLTRHGINVSDVLV